MHALARMFCVVCCTHDHDDLGSSRAKTLEVFVTFAVCLIAKKISSLFRIALPSAWIHWTCSLPTDTSGTIYTAFIIEHTLVDSRAGSCRSYPFQLLTFTSCSFVDVFMYRDLSIALVLDVRRRSKAVMHVLDSMIRSGVTLARSIKLTVQWEEILRASSW